MVSNLWVTKSATTINISTLMTSRTKRINKSARKALIKASIALGFISMTVIL